MGFDVPPMLEIKLQALRGFIEERVGSYHDHLSMMSTTHDEFLEWMSEQWMSKSLLR